MGGHLPELSEYVEDIKLPEVGFKLRPNPLNAKLLFLFFGGGEACPRLLSSDPRRAPVLPSGVDETDRVE